MEGSADRTGINQQLGHGVDRHAADAGGGPEARPLNQHREDLDALRNRKFVHAGHDMNFYA